MFRVFVEERHAPRVMVPTGTTVVPFYAAAAPLLSWDRLTLLLLDEFGGLPPDDPGRCAAMIDRHLLQLTDPPPAVLKPDVDGDTDTSCRDYRRTLQQGVDLAILGLGANGHVGMNEPGSDVDSQTRMVQLDRSTSEHAAEYGVSHLPTWGITAGFDEILAAHEVWLLVTGDHKARILDKTLHDPVGPHVPATQLRQHSRFTVIADYSAAGADLIAKYETGLSR